MSRFIGMADAKLCVKCGATKALEEFHRHSGYRDGRRSTCKGCRKLEKADRSGEVAKNLALRRSLRAASSGDGSGFARKIKTDEASHSRRGGETTPE